MNTTTRIEDDKTFEIIKRATNKMVDLIRPTFGAASNKIIIHNEVQGYLMVVDDGVAAAREYKPDDPAERTIVKLIREAAIRTNDRVGDGTTGALIMLQAIINEVARKAKIDGHKIEQELKSALEEVVAELRANARPIETQEELEKVARISFDNEAIAKMIADIYYKLGKDGIVTIDRSSTMDTYTEIAQGIRLDRGYLSPYMITNPERMETIIEKPHILITDYRLVDNNDVLPIMDKCAQEGINHLVIICDNLEQSALATVVLNIVNKQFHTTAINAPTGDSRTVTLEDIALLTGSRVVSHIKGDKLDEVQVKDLGRAERFIARRNESIIVEPKGDPEEIKKLAEELKSAMDAEKTEHVKKELERRYGMFTGKLATIRVGAPTEQEQKALKYKVEDAVHAVKAAYRGGVVCGAGLALAHIQTKSKILNEALQHPHKQLCENMGVDVQDLPKDTVTNMITGQTGDYMDVGVLDPADVLIAGVESAVSVASILVTSHGMIIETEHDTRSN